MNPISSGKIILSPLIVLSFLTPAFPPLEQTTSKWEDIPEVAVLLEVYGDFIQETTTKDNDVAFLINKTWVYFRNGRMLTEEGFRFQNRYQSIFYDYPLGKLIKPPKYQQMPVRSSDFLDLVFGTKETLLREQCDWVPFLDHKAYMNHFCEEALRKVETEIFYAAKSNVEVEDFVENLKIIYSFQQKIVRGSENSSHHSYGLALDLVPNSYDRKHANWKWSTAFIKEWHLIPLEKRWTPPQAVIDAFEKNGFIWGGKWSHFDTIHFEYAPEILRLTRLKNN